MGILIYMNFQNMGRKPMTKTLTARKCKDGWIIEIRETHCVDTETDVRKFMKMYNLHEVKEHGREGKKIYAEV